MTRDFRASQIQSNKLIASGSTGTNADILFYDITSEDSSDPNKGNINPDAFSTGSIGKDIFLYVSGTVSSGSDTDKISVFGGSVRVSGNLVVDGNIGNTAETLQTTYDNSADAIVDLDSTQGAVQIRDTASGLSGDLFNVENSNGSERYFTVSSGSATVSGTLNVRNNNSQRFSVNNNSTQVSGSGGTGIASISNIGNNPQILVDEGSTSSPGYSFKNNTSSGIRHTGTGLELIDGGSVGLSVFSGVTVVDSEVIRFSGTGSGWEIERKNFGGNQDPININIGGNQRFAVHSNSTQITGANDDGIVAFNSQSNGPEIISEGSLFLSEISNTPNTKTNSGTIYTKNISGSIHLHYLNSSGSEDRLGRPVVTTLSVQSRSLHDGDNNKWIDCDTNTVGGDMEITVTSGLTEGTEVNFSKQGTSGSINFVSGSGMSTFRGPTTLSVQDGAVSVFYLASDSAIIFGNVS